MRIAAAIQFTHSHYRETLTVAMLARAANLSTSRFYRVFKQDTGLSPHRYVTRLRMQRAEDLLRNTDLSIKEIAFEVGYNSEDRFVKVFKTFSGRRPSEHRRWLQTAEEPQQNLTT